MVVKPLDKRVNYLYNIGMKSVKVTKRNEKLKAYYRKHPGMSYAALGRVFKLTRERIRQILG